MKNSKGDSAAEKTKKAQVKSIVRREKEERVTEIFFSTLLTRELSTLYLLYASSRERALIRASSSSEKAVFSNARRLSAIWAVELAPMMTDVTRRSDNSHASAISASVCPRRRARSFSPRMRASMASVSTSLRSERPSAMHESCGMPLRYRPVSSPCASGEKATNPEPDSVASDSTPDVSGLRCKS